MTFWKWCEQRLREKSTLASLTGLLTALLPYMGVPPDLQTPLAGFLGVVLMSFAVTEG